MNQSKTKTKVTFIATIAICFVCLLLVGAIVEIRFYNIYTQKISAQEQTLEELKNAERYYDSENYKNNSLRDQQNAGNDGDLIFEEE